MREQYWRMYNDLYHRLCYYKHFQNFYTWINRIISSLLTITSLSSIAAWGVWGSHPIIWSLIIGGSQLIQALFPKLPYNDILISTKFIICSMDKLILSIEHEWLESEYVRDYTEQEYFDAISKHENAYSDLVSQYFSGSFLPEHRYLHSKAMNDCQNYFERKYGTTQEVQNDFKSQTN